MHTNPLTGTRYPDNADATNLSTYFQNIADDLSPQAVPQYSSATTRDSAVSSWTAAGHTFTQGLALVNGAPQMYRGKWVPLDQTLYRRVLSTATGTLAGTTNLCAIQTIPASPFGTSVGYWVDFEASVHASSIPAGLGMTLEVLVDGVSFSGSTFTNGGTSACQDTRTCRDGATFIDNSTHTIQARISSLGGTITVDQTWGKLLLTIRPYAVF